MQNHEQVSDAVVRKIQLLLNLAQRPGTEEEGVAAMARAQEILAKYNLDLSVVQDKVVAGGTAAREAESKRGEQLISRSAMYNWQQKLVRTVAQANFCVYWVSEVKEARTVFTEKLREQAEDWDLHVSKTDNPYRTRKVKRHTVLGRLVNTTAVNIMADYLFDTIERLLPFPRKQMLSQEAVYWREGCVDRLCERITAKAEAMKKADYATQGEQAYTTAIMVADLAKKEEAANYDHRWGAGAWAAKLQREAEWQAKHTDEYWAEQERKQEEERKRLLAAETPEEKAKRERKEQRQRESSERRWEREYEKRSAKINSSAFRAGRVAGDSINLDGQLGSSQQKGLR